MTADIQWRNIPEPQPWGRGNNPRETKVTEPVLRKVLKANRVLFRRRSFLTNRFIQNVQKTGEYGLQMLTTSPILSMCAFHPNIKPKGQGSGFKARLGDQIARGESAKAIHKVAGLPWGLRKLSIHQARILLPMLENIPMDIISNHAPSDPKRMIVWFKLCAEMSKQVDYFLPGDFSPMEIKRWFYKAMSADVPPSYGSQWLNRGIDVGHWVKASLGKSFYDRALFTERVIPYMYGREHVSEAGRNAVDRKWSLKIGWKAAIQESELWGDRIRLDSKDATEYPPPWFPDTKIDGYKLQTIRHSRELATEGREMRHCVADYSDRINYGRCNILSLRDPEGGRALTIEITRFDQGRPASINQIRGYCNRPPNKQERPVIEQIKQYLKDCEVFM